MVKKDDKNLLLMARRIGKKRLMCQG